MVIIFSDPRVREFLIKNGYVITVRRQRKRIGRDWMTDKRGGKKIMDVKVWVLRTIMLPVNRKLREMYLMGYLRQYVRHSGFRSVNEWVEAIRKLNKGRIPTWLKVIFVIKSGVGMR